MTAAPDNRVNATGGCLCGAVRYEIIGDLRGIVNCHLMVHSHDAHELSKSLLELERISFLDGHYFSFVLRTCHACKVCTYTKGKDCPNPLKIRPCEAAFGIDVYQTARTLGLPCRPLQTKEDIQNRYGFLLIN
jgi:predicted metal-binding protein